MEEPFETHGVRGILHRPDRANGHALALTHGAGSNCKAPLLVRLAHAFEAAGYVVLRYDLPFRRLRAKGPPFPAQAERDREGVACAAEALREFVHGHLFLGGHSYGGRQSAMLAAARPEIATALLLLSYPLHPPRKPEQLRTAFFPQLQLPALFVHGTNDPFGSLEELRAAMGLISTRTDLLAVEGAGHDLGRAADLAVDVIARLEALASYPPAGGRMLS
ncbi:MAG TPA: alpha/beta family hydrolase [Bryobacteraceae bacterium]|nr:alpha/beta family hydrolase [Bryobacteraceae bacterium]